MVERATVPVEAVEAPNTGRRPWFLRAGIPTAWLGVPLGITLLVLAALAWSVSAPIDYARKPFELRLPAIMGLSLAILYWMVSYYLARANSDFDLLGTRFDASSAEIAAARSRLSEQRRDLFWLGTAVAFVSTVAVQQLNTQRWSRFASGDWNAFDVFSAAMVLLTSLLIYQAAAFAISVAIGLGRAAGELLEVRLFDSGVAAPLVRFGLRTTILFVVAPMVTFGAFVVLAASPWATLAFYWLLNVGFSVVCMVIPVARVHQIRVALKHDELARVERAVHGDAAALAGSPLHAGLADLDLPGLLAYRREVADASEWPFDAPALRRFLAYMVIPPASWLAAALVERGLERWLEG
ncbi:MAG: hypothetical protein ABFS41_04755 [Myxococcota bacterium]